MVRRLLLVLALVAVFSAASHVRLRATSHYFATQRYEDLYYLPPPAWLTTFSLGYREAFADFIWMRALVYYGEGFVQRIALRHVFDYARAATVLDPDFRAVYRWASTATAYQSQAAPVEDLMRAGALLDEGAARFPESGELAWQAGSFWAFEVAPRHPPGSADRRRALDKGNDYLMRAARRGAGPPWLALSNATQMQRLGQQARAIEHLEEMYALTTDDQVRSDIARRIATLRSRSEREALERSLAEAERSWRTNYPYLPPALYELVGPRSLLDSLTAPR